MAEQIYSTTNQAVAIYNRIRGAIWGQFVGDAFCLGSHWIYDLAELGQRFPGGPQGFDTPASGHYHFGKQSGDLTHYGDGALLQLQSLAEQGRLDVVDFGSRFVTMIESTAYRGYRDHAAQGTVANARQFRLAHPGEVYGYQDGADDDQPATISRLAPLAALYFRASNYLTIVESATRICQNNNRTVAYAQAHALVLRELFLGNSLPTAFSTAADLMRTKGLEGSEVADKIQQAFVEQNQDVTSATLKFGQMCPLANSFPAAVQCVLHYANDMHEAIRATAAAGGDNAARAAMIGTWLGAALGLNAIPAELRVRLNAKDSIETFIERIVALSDQTRDR